MARVLVTSQHKKAENSPKQDWPTRSCSSLSAIWLKPKKTKRRWNKLYRGALTSYGPWGRQKDLHGRRVEARAANDPRNLATRCASSQYAWCLDDFLEPPCMQGVWDDSGMLQSREGHTALALHLQEDDVPQKTRSPHQTIVQCQTARATDITVPRRS